MTKLTISNFPPFLLSRLRLFAALSRTSQKEIVIQALEAWMSDPYRQDTAETICRVMEAVDK